MRLTRLQRHELEHANDAAALRAVFASLFAITMPT
jgi:hypothetical protein